MQDRHPIFGGDYIEETVELFLRLQPDELTGLQVEAEWAEAVLRRYFQMMREVATGTAPSITRARDRFIAATSLGGNVADRAAVQRTTSDRLEPYSVQERVPIEVSFANFEQLAQRRRSVRWFLPQAVPVALIEQALEVARQAPSACNRQPFRFLYFGQASDAQTVASVAMGTSGYAHQIPALMVLIGDWSCFEDERDRHVPYIDGALCAMQFMLACETLGLATCAINWPDVERLERRMDELLSLNWHERPIMLIAVGYPDPRGGVAGSAKKSVAALLEPRTLS